jgi:catechol 2,3-dioxygenase-like lactoylglutathione lyase family enzyme
MMTEPRTALKEYVKAGKLMQLATLSADGSPHMCNVWYDPHFDPDVLRFISRHDRVHSKHIRAGRPVAGSIVAIHLEGLGQVARGVTYSGTAIELPQSDISDQLSAFISRWPNASQGISEARLRAGEIPTRLYEVRVAEWVLFDEENFPDQPRQVVSAECSATSGVSAVPTYSLHHVALSVNNMAESTAFYHQFGFRSVHSYRDSAGTVEISHLRLGPVLLELFCYRTNSPAPSTAWTLETDLPRIGVKHLALGVPSLDAAVRDLEERGIALVVPPQTGRTGIKYVFVKDPSGNLLEVVEDQRGV